MADNVIDSLSIEIEANATKSVDGIKKLSSALRSLANSTAKVNSANLNNVVNQLDRLQNVAGKTGNTANNATKGVRNFSGGLNTLHSRSSKAGNGMKSLAYHFGKFYANCFLAIRGVKALGKAVTSTMDYLEGFNFFDVAIGKATSTGWQEAGYKNAEAYKTAFENALGNENAKLSGFSVDNATGDFTPTGTKNLGLDIGKLQQFQGEITSVTNALGLSAQTSQVASIGFSKLAGDMSSLKNVSLDKVMADFQSGLLGQSRALYKYGVDITNATLQQYAYNNGISESISKMTQGEKMQLRMLAILDQSKVAWGDLANTINQPANQLRMFTVGVKNLAMTIGKILMPMVTGVLPYLNAMVIALQRFFNWIAKLAGIKLDNKNTGAGTTNVFDGIEDSADNASGAVDNLNKKVKELNKQLAPFDELNNLTTSTSGGGSGSSGGDGGLGSAIDLSDAINKAFDDYFKVWDEAYARSQQKAEQMADAIVEAFKKGDYKAIGTYISTALTDALNGIPWNNIYSVANQFGTGFAQFLNGLITPQEFYAIGQTIAGVLNTVLYSSLSFASTFDWSNFGNSIAMGINGVFENFDFKSAGQAVSKWVNGLLTALLTALQNTNWQRVGQSIGEFFGNIDWKSVTWNLAQLVEAFAEALLNAIEGWFTTDPLSATIVGGFAFMKLSGIGGIIGSAIADKLTVSETATIGEKISGKLKAIKVIAGIAIAISGITMEAKAGSSETSLLEDAEGAFLTAAGLGLATGNWVLAVGIGVDLEVANLSLKFGNFWAGTDFNWGDIFKNLIDPSFWGDLISYSFKDFTSALFNFDLTSELADATGYFFDSVKECFDNGDWLGVGKNVILGIVSGFGTAIAAVGEPFLDFFNWVWNGICSIFGIHSPAKEMQPLGDYIFQGILEGFKGAWDSFTEAVAEFFEKYVAPIFSAETWMKNIGSIKDALGKKWDEAKKWWDSNKPTLSDVKAKYEEIKNKLSEKWTKAQTWWDNNKPTLADVKAKYEDVKAKLTEKWESAKSWWNDSKPDLKEIKSTIEDVKKRVQESWRNVTSYWNTKEKLQQIKTTIENVKSRVSDAWSNVRSFWNSKDKLGEIKSSVENFSSNVRTKWNSVVSYWSSKGKLADISAKVEDFKSNALSLFNSLSSSWGRLRLPSIIADIKLPHINVDWKDFGKFSLPSFSVKWYAKGGFPEEGNMFVAGEAGAEMVGKINGKTGVASNAEITGIRDAVYDSGEAQLAELREQNSLLRQLLAKDMGISSRDVFNAVRNEDANYENMTGHSAFVR